MNIENKNCPFCSQEKDRMLFETDLTFALWSKFEVSKGHTLIIPKRHVSSWFKATNEEKTELMCSSLDAAKKIISETYGNVDGFNIGINVGPAAGQTVMHLHVHLIPRYFGDVENPTGGVRNVIPDKGNYLTTPSNR